MRRGRDGAIAAAASVAIWLALSGSAASQAQQAATLHAPESIPCGGNEIARGPVRQVFDGRTFVLADGRAVRLAAIEVPLVAATETSAPGPGADAARDALAKLVDDVPVALRQAEFSSDRYGRILAYADTPRGADTQSLQAALLSGGFARVGDAIGSRPCALALLAREAAARKAKLGLWADPYYDPVPADKPAEVLRHRGRYALIEGKVVSVRQSGSILYVNFGRHWSEDFAVTIRKRNERSFAAAGVDLQALPGRRVRVRGWVEARGGEEEGAWRAPWLEAAHPAQIEEMDRD